MSKKKPKPLDRARIITVYNQKGGCGKTQISMQLAGTLGLRGFRVAVFDMDPQGTSSKWSSSADEDAPFPASVFSLAQHETGFLSEVRKSSGNYDFIIFDCPPTIRSGVPWAALQVSDLGLIPLIPVVDNIQAAQVATELGLKAQIENPSLQLRFVPSHVGRGGLYQDGLNVIRELEDIEMLETGFSSRVSFPQSNMYGSTVHRFGKKAGAAIEEVEALATSVLKVLSVKG